MAKNVRLKSLTPHPLNSKLFKERNAEDIEILAKDIEANGLKYPIEIDTKGTIIKGESRVRAARLLGWKTIKANVCKIEKDEDVVLELVRDNTARRHLSHSDRLRIYQHFAPEFFKNMKIEAKFIESLATKLSIKSSLIKKDLTKIRSGKSADANSIQYFELKNTWEQAVGKDVMVSISDSVNGTHVMVSFAKNRKRIAFGPGKYSTVMREANESAKMYQAIKAGNNQFTIQSKDIGLRIRDLRLNAGYTQANLAKKINISQSYLSEIEQGLCRCTASVLDDVMLVCGT